MDTYDMSAEYLRSRVEQIATQISQQATKTPAGVHPDFIGDIVNAVENAVGGVVNATEDAVNAAVNATHDAVNAVENIGERAVTATERIVDAVTAHTEQIIHIANIATEAIKVIQVTADITAEIGVADITEASSTGKATTGASATQLIQARRAAILEQRTAIINSHQAKRTELKSKIAAVAARLAASKPNT